MSNRRFWPVSRRCFRYCIVGYSKKLHPKNKNVTDVEIIDFKSQEKTDGEYQADHEKQLRYYGISCLDSLGLHPENAWVHHLSEEDQTKVKSKVDISEKILEQTKDEIKKQVSDVLKRKFGAKPRRGDDTCRECDYQCICSKKSFETEITLPSGASTVRASVKNTKPASKTVVSARTKERAKMLAKNNVVRIDEGMFEVESGSDPDKRYTITDGRCTCMGYRNYSRRHEGKPTCSHVEAVKVFKKSSGI